MGLVQLTLPDAPTPQRERRNVVGIDLGTTNSLVATVTDGTAQVITGGGRGKDHAFGCTLRCGRSGSR